MERSPFIGQLDRKIQIIEVTEVQNAVGEMMPTDVIIAQPFAYMQEKNGGEDTEGKVRHLYDRTYTIRYNKTIRNKGIELYLLDGAQRFQVYHVKEIGRRKHLEIFANNVE